MMFDLIDRLLLMVAGLLAAAAIVLVYLDLRGRIDAHLSTAHRPLEEEEDHHSNEGRDDRRDPVRDPQRL